MPYKSMVAYQLLRHCDVPHMTHFLHAYFPSLKHPIASAESGIKIQVPKLIAKIPFKGENFST
jgi:hypothetical protein